MEIRFNVTGAERKNLVAAVSEVVGFKAEYMKAPSFAYTVSFCTIDKNGTLIFDEQIRREDAHALLISLAERGFVSEDEFDAENPAGKAPDEDAPVEADPTEEIPADDVPDRLVIEMPLEEDLNDTALNNLEKLVASKATLIMKSVGTDVLPIELGDERIRFPWFSPDSSPEAVGAYSQFIHALCAMAKKQKRITAKEKSADSEKFAFRCFLLRLGFIGAEYAVARKILLANLSGDSSFKNGKRKDKTEAASEVANAANSGAESEIESNADDGEPSADSAETGGDEC